MKGRHTRFFAQKVGGWVYHLWSSKKLKNLDPLIDTLTHKVGPFSRDAILLLLEQFIHHTYLEIASAVGLQQLFSLCCCSAHFLLFF